MDDEIKNTHDDLVNDNLTDQENDLKHKASEDLSQSKGESNAEHRVIHKKDGKLHIYVRQDKYKGELKSKNWVGRTYINGKQKVSSSGTTNLDEAIPILEKWFDDLYTNKDSNENKQQNEEKKAENSGSTQIPPTDELEQSEITAMNQALKSESDKIEEKKTKLSMFERLKNIKIGKSKTENKNIPGQKSKKKGISSFFNNFFKSKVSKLSVSGEEIAGLDISKEAIRVCQVSQDKEEKWILDKFSYRLLDQEKISENVLDSKDYISEEISLALANAKITSKNIAMSIPVTSAIIRVVPCPIMSDDELQKAIETDSLWENLVQITDNLNDYSVFHQVINRNSKTNQMEILFVASKLSDVNSYSSIAKKAGLNPVIVDVRCFTLKNAHDNSKFKSVTDKGNSAILELSADENYLMIIHNNIPVITDIFLRQPEKEMLKNIGEDATNNNEGDAVIRRYAMQLKQALADYEGKYETKISNIQVVSSLKNVNNLIPEFKKNLPTIGFNLFDPLAGVAIPAYNEEKTNLGNRSPIAPVIGLAYRKLDVFGYYKFVTAVKNINLLPNREAVRQKGRMKFLSGFAFKGFAGAVGAIYLFLIIFSFFQINSNKKQLVQFDQIQAEHDQLNMKYSKLLKRKKEMTKSLELGKVINSNQTRSYRALAQVTRSVPLRVQFTRINFDGNSIITIEGRALDVQDILNFTSNLNSKSLIEDASIENMEDSNDQADAGNNNKKNFKIICKLKAS